MNIRKNFLKQVIFPFFLVLIIQQAQARHLADWTILTFIQADNNLASFALKNIESMQNIVENKTINVLTHWNKPDYSHAVRCEVKAKRVIEHETFKLASHKNNIQESICASMDWAINKYPARHYMLILWNHGTGIIDRSALLKGLYPIVHFPAHISWFEVPGLDSGYDNRGILYSDSTRTYLSNQQLVTALQHITTKLGRKIDIIGMDACLMAMLEVGYQIKDYVHYMVASQNSEPGFGWNYEGFLNPLSKSAKTYTPKALAQYVVSAYKKLYEQKISWYTQSVLDISKIEALAVRFNSVCRQLLKCNAYNHPKTRKILLDTQEQALHFDTKSFVDLSSFCTLMIRRIDYELIVSDGKNPFQKQLKKLLDSLLFMAQELVNVVVAHEEASRFKTAGGISFYFPTGSIHHSYEKTLFSQNTAWLEVLNKILSLNVHSIKK